MIDAISWSDVQSGALGDVIRIKAFSSHLDWRPDGWFVDPLLAGGGALLDLGVHAIDTTRYILGDPLPLEVFARVGTHYGNIAVDDTASMVVSWDNGAYATIECGWSQPHVDSPLGGIHVYGTAGFGQLFPPRITTTSAGGRRGELSPDGEGLESHEHMPPTVFDAQFQHFIDVVMTEAEPISSASNGLVNASILDAAYRGAASTRQCIPTCVPDLDQL